VGPRWQRAETGKPGYLSVGLPAATAQLVDCAASGEIAFSQASGCATDGAEFCLPRSDEQAERQVASAIRGRTELDCGRPGPGRASCDPSTERRCVVQVRRDMCVAGTNEMNDAGWTLICDLARLPAISQVVRGSWRE
jgi:hypothetical protein